MAKAIDRKIKLAAMEETKGRATGMDSQLAKEEEVVVGQPAREKTLRPASIKSRAEAAGGQASIAAGQGGESCLS